MSDGSPNRKRLDGDTAGWSDAGQRVPIVWPQDGGTIEGRLLDALREKGAQFPDEAAALATIQSALDVAGDIRAAEALAMLFDRLPGGRRGDELRAAFVGMGDESFRKTAARHGVSGVTWFKAIKRLRRRLFGKSANNPGYL
jgi:hypothetical protein